MYNACKMPLLTKQIIGWRSQWKWKNVTEYQTRDNEFFQPAGIDSIQIKHSFRTFWFCVTALWPKTVVFMRKIEIIFWTDFMMEIFTQMERTGPDFYMNYYFCINSQIKITSFRWITSGLPITMRYHNSHNELLAANEANKFIWIVIRAHFNDLKLNKKELGVKDDVQCNQRPAPPPTTNWNEWKKLQKQGKWPIIIGSM